MKFRKTDPLNIIILAGVLIYALMGMIIGFDLTFTIAVFAAGLWIPFLLNSTDTYGYMLFFTGVMFLYGAVALQLFYFKSPDVIIDAAGAFRYAGNNLWLRMNKGLLLFMTLMGVIYAFSVHFIKKFWKGRKTCKN